MTKWLREPLHDSWAQSLEVRRDVHDVRAGGHRLRVFENPTFGRVFTLDGVVQTTERDNFIYHEMMAHVPILAHGAVRRVLIVGGGDGGMAREVLKHGGIENVTLVETKTGIVDAAKTHLPMLSQGAFEDPRLELVFADGARYVQDTQARFDIIIVDSTDPDGPDKTLFTETFYDHAHHALARGGILVTQNGVPFLQGAALTRTMRALKSRFIDWTCYTATVPSYAGGPMAFGWGTDSNARQTPIDTIRDRFRAADLDTAYYTPEVHAAAFALPRYIQRLMP